MLNIDKSTVDFLVTENMVTEVEKVLEKDVPKIRNIVNEIAKRGINKVYFVACGSPLCACETATILFEKYSNINSKAYSGYDFLDSTPYNLDEKTAVIALSQSGNTEEVVEALKKAKATGALTVSVTRNPSGNLLAPVGDYLVAYEAECIWEIHLLITYTFALELINKVTPSLEITKILEDILKLPKILGKLVTSWESKGRTLGEKASNWDIIYTVAAGPLTPLAYKEGVITMMEFAWTHGANINSSEFRHGPLEIVEEGVPFIFLLGTDESRHTTERTINFVKKLDKDYIVFDYKEIAKDLHPMLSPFVLFVPLEWFFYYLSIYKDHNPDDRRYYGGIVKY
ncbi:fructoselysine 6-phosphate deglycase [uncultured Clostridium sp.]|uniref:fructoselysine 6-phosphate deglycase n=1 Tax=uncultured Clostridium sp. TaxID=59620 RepID=UPI000E9514A4|nr:fructoselysine-6-P-deglycase [Clostridium sp.]